MYAVLIELDVGDIDRDEGLAGLREHVVPAIARLPGFRSGTWLAGNEKGKGLSLTVWETQEAAQEMANRFGPGSGPQAGAMIERCEVREVAATA